MPTSEYKKIELVRSANQIKSL